MRMSTRARSASGSTNVRVPSSSSTGSLIISQFSLCSLPQEAFAAYFHTTGNQLVREQ